MRLLLRCSTTTDEFGSRLFPFDVARDVVIVEAMPLLAAVSELP